ncbi:MAG: hypothetical protein ABIL09_11115 [Gemmatimonadota bacterium]
MLSCNLQTRVDLTMLLPARPDTSAKRKLRAPTFNRELSTGAVGLVSDEPAEPGSGILSRGTTEVGAFSRGLTLGAGLSSTPFGVDATGKVVLGDDPTTTPTHVHEAQYFRDLRLSTVDDGTPEIVRLDGLEAVSYEWTRHPMSEPDELQLTLAADVLPVDLRLIRGLWVNAWLFSHGRPDKCRPGDAGYFSGVVTGVDRDRNENTLKLDCVDLTKILLTAEISLATARGINLHQPIADLIASLISATPGCSNWRVIDATAGWVQEIEGDDRSWAVLPGEMGQAQLTTWFGGRQLVEILGGGRGNRREKVWPAIMRLCALAGVIPEVAPVPGTGAPAVWIIDPAKRIETRTGIPFRRAAGHELGHADERGHRIMLLGGNVATLEETLNLDRGPKLDAIEIVAADPDTGEMRRARYGRKGRRVHVMVANGVTAQQQLDTLAERTWRSLQQGEFRVTIGTLDPWSLGGGPDQYTETDFEPGWASDLLSLEAGEPLEVVFYAFESLATAGALAVLKSRGIPEEEATKISDAQDRLQPSLVFQVIEVEHDFGDEYECKIRLQTYLDDAEVGVRLQVDPQLLLESVSG